VQRLVDEDGQAGQAVGARGQERHQQRGEDGEDRGAAHPHTLVLERLEADAGVYRMGQESFDAQAVAKSLNGAGRRLQVLPSAAS
jgi:hypothetical protein